MEVEMKDIAVWLVMISMMSFATRYVYMIWKHKIKPALSTWMIFLIGTGLSLITYAIAEKHDFRSGILNTMDVLSVTTVLVATILWGNRKMLFRRFEKWYLIAAAGIVAYGIISGDAWHTNIFTQGLITLGYLPTIQKLVVEKKNSESFGAWAFGILSGIIALYPALKNGNSLATLYASRTVVVVAITISVMAYYQFRHQDRADPTAPRQG